MPDFLDIDPQPLLPALLAFLLALALALAGRWLRRPWLSAIAVGAGLLVGWWWTFGLLTASPRQLPERLPLLALGMVALAACGAGMARWRWVPALVAAGGVLAAGWWMAGAPLQGADLLRAWPVLAGVAAFAAVALRQPGRWSASLAALALLVGLALAPLPGPGRILAGVCLAAALAANLAAALAAGPGSGKAGWGKRGGGAALAGALPFAAGLAALAALPVLARGSWADASVAAAPLSVLWLAPWVAGLLPRWAGPLPAAVLAAAPWLFAAWLLG